MKEVLITLETSLLLDAIGFDDKTYSIFNYEAVFYDDESEKVYVEKLNLSINETLWKKELVFPPQSVVQKWLREKEKIHVEVYYQGKINEINKYKNELLCYKFSDEECYDSDVTYNSYELALESGLIEALEWIKKKQNENA